MNTQEAATSLYVVSRPESRALGRMGLVRHFAILERCRNAPDLIHERYEGCTGVQSRQATSGEVWRIEEPITDRDGAMQRLDAAQQWGAYSAILDNCEHMAHYIATGVKRSYQVQTGILVGLAATVLVVAIYRKQKAAAIPRLA